jgi:D-alanine-D-alanine ligase
MPLVLKPPREGSTVGITRVSSLKEWEEVLKKAFEYDDEILAEHFVEGIEITAGVVDGRALPLIEIQYPGLMYDYDAKYTHANGETFYICPPDSLSVELREKAKETALEFYHVVRARDLLRIDMIVDSKGDIFVLEANSIPGFTASSLVPKAATAAGISFTELCAGIAVRGLSRSLKNELN